MSNQSLKKNLVLRSTTASRQCTRNANNLSIQGSLGCLLLVMKTVEEYHRSVLIKLLRLNGCRRLLMTRYYRHLSCKICTLQKAQKPLTVPKRPSCSRWRINHRLTHSYQAVISHLIDSSSSIEQWRLRLVSLGSTLLASQAIRVRGLASRSWPKA